MNFPLMLLLLILALFINQSDEAKKVKEKSELYYKMKLGIKIGKHIVRLPSDMAKLLAWKAVRLHQKISKTVGVQAVISKLKIVTPKRAQQQLRKLKNNMQIKKHRFILGEFKYTIATGPFGIIAYRSKIPEPVIIRKPKLKEKIATAFHKSNANIAKTFSKSNLKRKFHESKSNCKNMFKNIRIPKYLEDYFNKLSERKEKKSNPIP